MARKAKIDWPRLVYKFDVVNIHNEKLPDEFWIIAKKMNELWNQLQRTFEPGTQAIRDLREQTIQDAKTLDKDAKKKRWTAYNKEPNLSGMPSIKTSRRSLIHFMMS